MNNEVNRLGHVMFLLAAFLGTAFLQAQDAPVGARVSALLLHYQPRATVKGSLAIPATDALGDLQGGWNRGFQKFHPGASLAFRARPGQDPLQTLKDGTASLVLSVRDLAPEETKAFQARFGYPPTVIPVGMDADIVIVNQSNPIKAISMADLDAVYSSKRLGGGMSPALVWRDLGVRGDLARRTINAYAQAEGSATRTTLAATALRNGPFRAGILDGGNSLDLAEAVSSDVTGIAIGPLASWFASTKTVPVVPYGSRDAFYPTQELVTSGKYPMVRTYYACLNQAPGKPLDPAVLEAVRFILSQEGQAAVVDAGAMPGPTAPMTIAMQRLDQ